jgi:predicted component of type VI protein secretion system
MMMKAQATLTKNLANTAVTVAAAVATLKKVLNMRKVLRRLISPAEIAEKLAL